MAAKPKKEILAKETAAIIRGILKTA